VLELGRREEVGSRSPDEASLAGRLTRPLVIMSIVIFVVLTVSVLVSAGPGLAIDKWLAAWPGLHTKNSVLAKLLAVVGQRAYSAPVLLVVAVLLAWRRRIWRPITLALIGLLSLNVIIGAMKLIIARPSPRTGNWLPFAGGTDFPSGHTSNTVLTWGLVAWLLLAFSRPVPTLTRQRVAYGLVALASVVVGGASLYLRTHWISDIVAGWAVGFLILVGVTRLQNVAKWRARLDRIEGVGGVIRRFDHRVSSQNEDEPQSHVRVSRTSSSDRQSAAKGAAMRRLTP
jgi:membrane-associated phospholipid phosphatase